MADQDSTKRYPRAIHARNAQSYWAYHIVFRKLTSENRDSVLRSINRALENHEGLHGITYHPKSDTIVVTAKEDTFNVLNALHALLKPTAPLTGIGCIHEVATGTYLLTFKILALQPPHGEDAEEDLDALPELEAGLQGIPGALQVRRPDRYDFTVLIEADLNDASVRKDVQSHLQRLGFGMEVRLEPPTVIWLI